MPAVFVHGVPETPKVWDPLRTQLSRSDVVALRLPGFGCPRPSGFGATKEEYVEWLTGELERIGQDGPIDLVGHDWGGGFTARLVSTRPELVRSWVTDAAGLAHADHIWHDFAKLWQTPGEGEAFFENQGPPEETAQLMMGFGLTEAAALKLARMSDPVMGTCILDLYRSAMPNPHKDWGDGYRASQKPCMVMTLTQDPFTGGPAISGEVAKVLGAKEAVIETGHFWPLEAPKEGAVVINEFVASLD